MASLRIRLCCGAGMSSGFLAQRMRAEAKKMKLDYQIEASSESQVPQYYGKFDILLLGPHYKSQLPGYQALESKYNFKVAVIPEKLYGSLDAKGMIAMVQSM